MEKKQLTRSNNRMIAGVCSGIADYFGWDVTLVRILYVLATFFTAFSACLDISLFLRAIATSLKLCLFYHKPLKM